MLTLVKAYAFGALFRSYIVNVFAQRRVLRAVQFPTHPAWVDRLVRALARACSAINALFGNDRSHFNDAKDAVPAAPSALRGLPLLAHDCEEYRGSIPRGKPFPYTIHLPALQLPPRPQPSRPS